MQRTSTRSIISAKRAAPDYSLEDQVGFLLRRAYQRASSNLVDRIGAYDLTAPQFATLARLYERGALSQNLLGRLVAMEPANIRDVVLRLKKRRLLETRRDPTDKRLILIDLTIAGVALVEQLLPVEIECTAKTLAPLNAAERKQLYGLLSRLAEG
ncbi:MarR family transcriptional regulator [Bradyrhizobium jicamae]|uniref:MarR family transcriptional regulator n=1 Tax=Bradyrhizobium jicamae TaxID=280332 RepID=A0ABS5FHF8_9BRAD|nr:MarR family transcriptional regulator [Bradyrhizobium jicamae]MBR0796222.1 MarR family transcriptional regulator [Bradyrhizobium jicamae]MBR0938793.1 MarR family transcriptional regulator [Bradyrhizobium jicamae]